MDQNVLQKLFCDPAFNPLQWMGEAFEMYIGQKPAEILNDPLCRKYVLEAMEPRDLGIVADALPLDMEVFETFINRYNTMDPQSTYFWRNIIKKFISKINTAKNEGISNTLQLVTKLENAEIDPIYYDWLIEELSEEQLIRGMCTWNLSLWSISDWTRYLPKISRRNLKHICYANRFPESICCQESVWIQNILYWFLMNLPHEDLTQWPDLITRMEDNKPSVNICDPLCRCGYYTTTTPGITLHRKSASISICQAIGLTTAYRVRLVRDGNIRLVRDGNIRYGCSRCGRICSSKSGYTLHMKKCCNWIDLPKPCI